MICDVMQRSGALERSEAEWQFVVADWLGRNVTSAEGRAFLVELARTPGPDKAALLTAAGRRAGLDDCPLARIWGDGG